MNRTILLAISAVAILGLAGCGTSGGIIPAASSKSEFDGAVYKGQTTVTNEKSITGVEYRIFNQGATGYTSNSANREDAEVRTRNIDFCVKPHPLRLIYLATFQG